MLKTGRHRKSRPPRTRRSLRPGPESSNGTRRRGAALSANARKPEPQSKTRKRATPPQAPARVETGSGNVFADLGLPNPEEALAKAEIARRVNAILATQKISQADAARLLGISQPRVSDLSRGRLAKFSLVKLMNFAKRLGNDVKIRIQPSRNPRLEVLAARRLR